MGLPVRDTRRLWLLGIVVLLASAARALLLVVKPIWHDELFTLWAARQPPASLWQALRYDSGPPLFYWLEKPCVWLGEALGRDEAARLLPFLVILLLFAGALSIKDTAARFRFVVLIAVSPLLLIYSAEARAYALLAAADFALFLVLFGYRPTPARLSAAALLVALALWTHYLAIFFVVALAILLAFRRQWPQVGAILIGILFFLLWIPVLLIQPAQSTAWMREPVLRSVLAVLSALGGAGRIPDPLSGPLPAPMLVVGAVTGTALLIALARSAWRVRDEASRDAVILTLLTIGFVLAASATRPLAFPGRSEMAVLPIWLWAVSRASRTSRIVRGSAVAAAVVAAVSSLFLLTAPKVASSATRLVPTVARAAGEGSTVYAAGAFYLPLRLAEERGALRARIKAIPASLEEHPGWFATAPLSATEIADLQKTLLDDSSRHVLLLLPRLLVSRDLVAALERRGPLHVSLPDPDAVLFNLEPRPESRSTSR
jgi:hypothetical protein